MDTLTETTELLVRVTEIAKQLEEIGEDRYASDIRQLMKRYVHELAGGAS